MFITVKNIKFTKQFGSTINRYSNACIKNYDVVVVGGGIVGMATAREILLRNPQMKLAIVEKENDVARHQSGNNSGVIHAGIYYKPGSLKAKLCVKGMNMMQKYCDERKVKHSTCGKLIVAIERSEIPRLLDLYDRGQKNNVKGLKLVDAKEIREIEPLCQGVQGIWSPNTGIVNFGLVTKSFVEDIEKLGGQKYLNFEVTSFIDSENSEYPIILESKRCEKIAAKYALTCCGLHSDTVAVLTGCSPDPKIIPFRGEYLYLKKEKSNLAKTNIYPVPDPRFPFLGVHVTPRIDGRIILGPNAILAFSKEGYSFVGNGLVRWFASSWTISIDLQPRWTDVNLEDLKQIVMYSGFRKLALKYGSFGFKEMARSLITSLQVKNLQKFIKEIKTSDVEVGPAGVRAQAMNSDGTLIEDFVFDFRPGSGNLGKRVLHVRNAPSPGATSSLAIGEMIADKMTEIMRDK